jgi:hypothetical protein
VWELNNPDLKATHTFGNDKVVRPVTRSASVKAERERLRVHVPEAFADDPEVVAVRP